MAETTIIENKTKRGSKIKHKIKHMYQVYIRKILLLESVTLFFPTSNFKIKNWKSRWPSQTWIKLDQAYKKPGPRQVVNIIKRRLTRL